MASLSSSSSSENAATSSTKSTNDDYADLSPYEIARLKQIEQNKRKLLELGLTTLAPKKRPAKEKTEGGKTAESERKRKKQVFQKEERAKRQKMLASPSMGSRRSSRLAYVAAAQGGGLKHDDDEGREDGHSTEEEEVSVDDTIHYDRMPMDPDELDDYEFEVYAAVRKWRLVRKRELDIEPYKICQNRTICELIRRRRNDPTYAMPTSERRCEELLACWGIGPSKAEGYGLEMIDIVDEWEDTLVKSRGPACATTTTTSYVE